MSKSFITFSEALSGLPMKIGLLVALACCCSSALAQKKIALGFRSGVTLSNFYDHHVDGAIPDFSFVLWPSPFPPNPLPSSSSTFYYESSFSDDLRTGFFSYFSLSVALKSRIVLDAAVGYAQKGIDMRYRFHSTTTRADNSTEVLDYQIKRNIRLDYISVPVTLRYNLGSKQRLYVLGGIYEGIAIGVRLKDTQVWAQKTTTAGSGSTMSESLTAYETESHVKRFDGGLVGAFGAMLPMFTKVEVGIEARCLLGLWNLPAKFETHGYHGFSETTKNISFEIGLKLQQRLSEKSD